MKRQCNMYVKVMLASFLLAVVDALLLFGLNPPAPAHTLLTIALYVFLLAYCACSVLRVLRPAGWSLRHSHPVSPAYHRT